MSFQDIRRFRRRGIYRLSRELQDDFSKILEGIQKYFKTFQGGLRYYVRLQRGRRLDFQVSSSAVP